MGNSDTLINHLFSGGIKMLKKLMLIALLTILCILVIIYVKNLMKYFSKQDLLFEKMGEFEYSSEIADFDENEWQNYCLVFFDDSFKDHWFLLPTYDHAKEKLHYYDNTYKNKFYVPIDEFDTENYTYIVTFMHELVKLQYSESQKNYIFLSKQYRGTFYFSKESKNKIYVYRIKKMYIDFDYDDYDKSFKLVD